MKKIPSIDFYLSCIKLDDKKWLMRSGIKTEECSINAVQKMFTNYLSDDGGPDEELVKRLICEAVVKHLLKNWEDADLEVMITALKIKASEELERTNLILPISVN